MPHHRLNTNVIKEIKSGSPPPRPHASPRDHPLPSTGWLLLSWAGPCALAAWASPGYTDSPRGPSLRGHNPIPLGRHRRRGAGVPTEQGKCVSGSLVPAKRGLVVMAISTAPSLRAQTTSRNCPLPAPSSIPPSQWTLAAGRRATPGSTALLPAQAGLELHRAPLPGLLPQGSRPLRAEGSSALPEPRAPLPGCRRQSCGHSGEAGQGSQDLGGSPSPSCHSSATHSNTPAHTR